MLKSLAIAIGMLVECGLQIHTISEPFYRLNYGHILLMTSMTIFSGSASDNNSNNQKKKKKFTFAAGLQLRADHILQYVRERWRLV